MLCGRFNSTYGFAGEIRRGVRKHRVGYQDFRNFFLPRHASVISTHPRSNAIPDSGTKKRELARAEKTLSFFACSLSLSKSLFFPVAVNPNGNDPLENRSAFNRGLRTVNGSSSLYKEGFQGILSSGPPMLIPPTAAKSGTVPAEAIPGISNGSVRRQHTIANRNLLKSFSSPSLNTKPGGQMMQSLCLAAICSRPGRIFRRIH